MSTILMIDDDSDLVAAMRALLEAHGHRFHAAMNGELGLKRVLEVRPDLIILDVMMDRYTEGFRVCQLLKDPSETSPFATYRHVPILVLSAIHRTTPLRFAPDQDRLPADAFVEKSTPPDQVLAAVSRLLGRAAVPQ